MSDTEKVSFNLGVVDLGKVDLLIEQGFYSNRTDFLVTAVRNLLGTHTATFQEALAPVSGATGVTGHKTSGAIGYTRVAGVVMRCTGFHCKSTRPFVH